MGQVIYPGIRMFCHGSYSVFPGAIFFLVDNIAAWIADGQPGCFFVDVLAQICRTSDGISVE